MMILGRTHGKIHLLITLGNKLTQRQIALGSAVLQRHDAVFLQHLVGRRVHRFHGERLRIGVAACKGDNIGVSIRFQDAGEIFRLKIRFAAF